MIIRLLSDLHAEGGYDKNLLKSQGEDVLVIAGDLHVGSNNVWTMLKQFAEHQPNIVYTYGNHEFYRQDYHDTCKQLEDWARYTSIKILNPGTVYYNPATKQLQDTFPTKYKLTEYSALSERPDKIYTTHAQLRVIPIEDAIAFIVAPLWTNFRNDDLSKLAASFGINDFRLIEFDNHYFTPNDCSSLFTQQAGYIKHQYEEIKLKKVIVTHFLPATECIDKQYLRPGITNTLNDYFANDLSDWISSLENTTWLHGHTHSLVYTTIGSTRAFASPYGYGKNPKYKESLIEL